MVKIYFVDLKIQCLASQSRSRSNSISRSRKNSLVTTALHSPEASTSNRDIPPEIQNEQSDEDKNTVPQQKEVLKNIIKSPIPNINVEEPPEV